MNLAELQQHLPPRPRDAHKGQFGHVLIIGGDNGMAGAVRLAGEAAERVGAGLVSIATRPEHATLIGAARPELMCHGVAHKQDVIPLLDRATVIVIGPGLGQTAWAQELLTAVLDRIALLPSLPVIIDADALNLLAQHPQKHTNWILTPHPGEAARLLHCDTAVIQHDRETAVRNIQHTFGGVCVLKGAGTLVCGEDQTLHQCIEGNPGMATAGMGDVLSGVIGGLLAQFVCRGGLLAALVEGDQQVAPTTIACLGVALHARAGDLAAAAQGQRGLLASDLFPYLQQLVNPHLPS